MIDKPDQPFHDPEADAELFKAIGEELADTEISVEKHPDHINDEKFAAQACAVLLDLMGVDEKTYRLANARRRTWSFDHGKSIAALRRKSEVTIPDAVADG